MNVRYQLLLVAALFTIFLPSLARCQEWAWQQKYDEGKAALDAQRFMAAEQPLSEAMNIANSFGKADIRYADTCDLLALDYTGQDKYPDAETFFLRALESYQRVKGPNDPKIAMVLNNLGALYALAGKADHSEPLYLRALAILEKYYGATSSELVVDLNALAEYYSDVQRPDDAFKYAKRSLDISAKTWGDDSPRLVLCLKIIGLSYAAQKKYTDAEPLLRRLVAIIITKSGKTSADLIEPLEILGEVCAKEFHYSDAAQSMISALTLRAKSLPALPTPAQLATTNKKALQAAEAAKTAYLEYCNKLQELGSFYVKGKDKAHYADAENYFLAVLKYREGLLENSDPQIVEVMNSLGELYLQQNRDTDALRYLQSALAIRMKLNAQSVESATSMCSLGLLYFKQKDYVNAEKMYTEALGIRKQLLGEDAPDVGSAMTGLAVIALVQNKFTDAEPLFQRAKEILEKAPDANAPSLIICLENYARLLEKTDRRPESIDLLTRVRELREKMEEDQSAQ